TNGAGQILALGALDGGDDEAGLTVVGQRDHVDANGQSRVVLRRDLITFRRSLAFNSHAAARQFTDGGWNRDRRWPTCLPRFRTRRQRYGGGGQKELPATGHVESIVVLWLVRDLPVSAHGSLGARAADCF